MKPTILTSLFAVFWGMALSHGAIYHVAPGGNDANTGAETQPFATVQRAVNAMNPGDECRVWAGTYSERVSTVRSGSLCSPIRIRAQRGANVAQGFFIRHQHIIVDGFEINPGPSTFYTGAIQLHKEAQNVQLLNNLIQNTAANVYGMLFGWSILPEASNQNCIVSNNILRNTRYQMLGIFGANNLIVHNTFDTSNSGDAIRMFGRDNIVRANYFTNISAVEGISGNHPDLIQTFGDEGVSAYNIVFEDNLAENCVSQFCQLEQKGVIDIRDWTFRNNLFVRVGWAANIDMEGVRWHNNTFYQCTTNTGHPLYFNDVFKGSAWRAEAINNVFIECGSDPSNPGRGWYYADPTLTDFNADYNYVCGPGYAPKTTGAARNATSFVEAHGINGGNPGLVSIASLDFRPLSSSVLVNSGADVGAGSVDFDGIARPQEGAFDRGAFEYIAGARPTPKVGSTLEAVPLPGPGEPWDESPLPLPLSCGNVAPTIQCPASQTITCAPSSGASVSVSVQISELNAESVQVQLKEGPTVLGTQNVMGPVSNQTVVFNVTLGAGAHSLTATVSDAVASASCDTSVTVQADATPPVISGTPAAILQGTDADNCGAVVSWVAPTALDNCAGPVSVTCAPASGSRFPVGTTWVTCTATDGVNTSSTTFTVTVTDDDAPVISGTPAPILQGTDANNCGAVVSWVAPTALDNCAGPVSVTCVPASGNRFPVGTTWVTCTATDGVNTSTTTFTVTVIDDDAPILSDLTATPKTIQQANHQMVLITLAYTATDACGIANLAVSATSNEPDSGVMAGDLPNDIQLIPGDPYHLYVRAERADAGTGRTYTIRVQATDAAGNTSIVTTFVNVPRKRK